MVPVGTTARAVRAQLNLTRLNSLFSRWERGKRGNCLPQFDIAGDITTW
jgi:hypothetical protein